VEGIDGFRCRKGSKIHAIVVSSGIPLVVTVGPANSNDAAIFLKMARDFRLQGKRGDRERGGEN
jgi:hypothetical protein